MHLNVVVCACISIYLRFTFPHLPPDLNKALRRCEKDLKKVTKERDELECAIDTMRENLSSTEQAKKELQRQVNGHE